MISNQHISSTTAIIMIIGRKELITQAFESFLETTLFQKDTPSGNVDFSRPKDRHFVFPRLISAIAEDVYALGGVRNQNVVRMSNYAPNLQNLNS